MGLRSSSSMWSSLRSISSRRRSISKRLLAEVMADEEGPILRLGGWVRMGPKWQSGLNSALFALRVGEALEETHSSLSHIVRPYPLVALTPSWDLFVHAKDLFVEANGGFS